MNKARANTVHALRRARERYKVVLRREDLRNMYANIVAGKECKKIKQTSIRRSIWNVKYLDKDWKVVIEQNEKAGRYGIVTCLPRS